MFELEAGMFEIERGANKKRVGVRRRARGEGAPPRGQSLASLSASKLRERFYSWRGASGRRYVCSVFPSIEETIVADFSQGVIIGVVGEGASRRPICVLSADDFDSERGLLVRQEARARGVDEWHIHFGVGDAGLRDLADLLLN